MNRTHKLIAGSFMLLLLAAAPARAASLLVEAEAFADRGGWSLDAQFVDIMGSPYLLAHGLGTPVADAETTVTLPAANATWRVWVRTRDWTPDFAGEKPGQFRVALNDTDLSPVFGIAPADWGWIDGGTVSFPSASLTIALRDLTGFNGRCDAIYLTTETGAAAPPADGPALALWRATQHGETIAPIDTAAYDLVVVGGGFGGCGAAIAAARSGLRVAFVQDRPVLGGNASQEIRVSSEGDRRYGIVDEIYTKKMGNRSAASITHDATRLTIVQNEPNIALFMPWRAYAAGTNAARRITHVDIRDVATGARKRLTAPLFVDGTGDGWIGYWAGADFRMGREARDEHGESLAPVTADQRTMGSSLMWSSKVGDEPADFPTDLPWAAAVAGARADTSGEWMWEYGINPAQDTIEDAEHIRDHLLRAIFGNFANAKLNPANTNRSLDFVPYVAGKRESRRFLGPYILTQQDVLTGRYFEDAVATTDWGIDLHFETATSYISSYTNHGKSPNAHVPYRCLFSRNVPNLFLAGRNISVTHAGLGSPRVMNTIAQFGVTIGYAAAICKAANCDPADVYRDPAKFADLRARLTANALSASPAWPANPLLATTSIVDNPDTARVRTYGSWVTSNSDTQRWGSNYLHDNNTGKGEKFVLYKPDTPLAGDYTVSTYHSNGGNRANNAPVWIITNDLHTLADAPPAYARSDNADTFMGNTEALVGRAAAGKHFRAYFRFDLSALPPDVLIDTAALTLTIRIPDDTSDNDTAGARGITVHLLDEPFDPATVTWNDREAATPWATPGGTFDTNATLTAIASPPYFRNVTNGQTFAFPPTAALTALIRNVQTNTALGQTLHFVVRTPDLETSYASRKLYRFAGARLDIGYVDPTVPPTLRIDLTKQQAQWRDITTVTVGPGAAESIRVLLGTGGTTSYVTADAVRALCVRTDIDPDDYDGNGLPNDWERRHFLQETGTDPNADPDGDGRTNLQEFLDGTDPLDPKSFRQYGTLLQISAR